MQRLLYPIANDGAGGFEIDVASIPANLRNKLPELIEQLNKKYADKELTAQNKQRLQNDIARWIAAERNKRCNIITPIPDSDGGFEIDVAQIPSHLHKRLHELLIELNKRYSSEPPTLENQRRMANDIFDWIERNSHSARHE